MRQPQEQEPHFTESSLERERKMDGNGVKNRKWMINDEFFLLFYDLMQR